ncbi:MAG TPA: ABC transporter substrate-binding protein [Candidatus Binatia bacterium]|jgi:ABC-type nitrate/sulfonate/bicarbonate transport system substrate-binding protein|nr:ABC transporter substrate-binding protein [Candidatus Binatia bacterium]
MKKFGLLLSLLLELMSFARSADAQAPLEKIRLAYSAIGGSQASFWIPYEAGIFRKHGLDVELLYVAGGGRAAQVVQSGEVPIGVFTGGAVINANLAGGDLVVIASSMNVMTFVVMARPEITRPEDLKGKKIGVSRFGSATDFGLRYVEEKWPVKRQRDFAVIQVGGVSDVYNALRAGALDAAVINAELAILARREGFRELADIAKMGINFPTSSVITTRSFIKRNENTVRKFMRGFVEGVHFAKTQRGPAIKIMQKYLRSSDAVMFDELYEMYVVRNIPRIPRPSPESLKTVLDQMMETDPRVANLKPEQFIDARFFQDLDKEGFIQKLWK